MAPADTTTVLLHQDEPVVGNRMLFHNGYYVSDITSNDISNGDTVYQLDDLPGNGYVDIPVNDLSHYVSDNDRRGKYVVMHPTNGTPLAMEPMDELELFVCCTTKSINGERDVVKGVYFGRTKVGDMRMLTHRDYSIDVRKVTGLTVSHRTIFGNRDVFFRVFTRKHENGNLTILDGSYLLDLFRLEDKDRVRMMTGTGGFKGWRCTELEKANSILWQSHAWWELTQPDSLKNTLALPAVAELVATGTVNGNTHTLPFSMRLGGKAIGYDVNGVLISIETIPVDSDGTVMALPVGVVNVEYIPGEFITDGRMIDEPMYGGEKANWFNEVYYYNETEGGQWLQGLIDRDYHIDAGTGEVLWDERLATAGWTRRTCKYSSHRRIRTAPNTLHYKYSMWETNEPVIAVGLFKTEVYINGHQLVEGIEYTVIGHSFRVNSAEYYNGDDPEVVIDVFHYGVSDRGEERKISGFIQHRKAVPITGEGLFIKGRNRVCFNSGCLVSADKLGILESPGTETDPAYREGSLWAAETRPMLHSRWGLRAFGEEDGYSEIISRSVFRHIPKPDLSGLLTIPKQHLLFSPFIKRVVWLLINKTLDVSVLGTSRSSVQSAMVPYLDLLAEDPTSRLSSDGQLGISPLPESTVTTISGSEMAFLREVVALYYNGNVTLNLHLRVV